MSAFRSWQAYLGTWPSAGKFGREEPRQRNGAKTPARHAAPAQRHPARATRSAHPNGDGRNGGARGRGPWAEGKVPRFGLGKGAHEGGDTAS